MKYATVYSDQNGKTHFKDETVKSNTVNYPDSPPAELSNTTPATQIFFAKMPKGWHRDWHTSEKRQYFCILKGQIEITVGDGEKRVFGEGDVVLTEDTTGKGHQGRVVGEICSGHYPVDALNAR